MANASPIRSEYSQWSDGPMSTQRCRVFVGDHVFEYEYSWDAYADWPETSQFFSLDGHVGMQQDQVIEIWRSYFDSIGKHFTSELLRTELVKAGASSLIINPIMEVVTRPPQPSQHQ
eukprot:TRINITY_DN3438_c0_g3_i1.p1 TRINITY_DN3438_c0_g3~~TRINITY_DN3438_c0_g3_i1.p1  ORF type:complete len:117 (-),score=17.53 TRINITY_DN3438_c0_g3_i1:137-487(-)